MSLVKSVLGMICLSILIVGCEPAPVTPADGPQLLREVTLAPDENQQAQLQVAELPTASPLPVTPEGVSPLQVVTVDADFVLVTPTLPPSKTPTVTPTVTPTQTQTPTPTLTATATQTTFLLPTSEIIPITQEVAAPAPRVCNSTWFFIQPRPEGCPLAPPNTSQGVYQEFQNGYMVWVGSQDAIYVMFRDGALPRWRAYRDFFNEGMLEDSSQYNNPPGPNLWQPRRGFGMLWRDNASVRSRIGWATQEWEQPFSVRVQTSNDGVVYISRPSASVFSLFPNGENWQVYGNSPNLFTNPGG